MYYISVAAPLSFSSDLFVPNSYFHYIQCVQCLPCSGCSLLESDSWGKNSGSASISDSSEEYNISTTSCATAVFGFIGRGRCIFVVRFSAPLSGAWRYRADFGYAPLIKGTWDWLISLRLKWLRRGVGVEGHNRPLLSMSQVY